MNTASGKTTNRTTLQRRVGCVLLCIAPFLAAIPIVVIMSQDGMLYELVQPAWWLLLFGPTVLVLLLAVAVLLLRRQPGRMPALDHTPRAGTVVSHRLQSVGEHSSQRVTTVEYEAADGAMHRSDLLEELTAESILALPPGSRVEVYAFEDPQYARTAVFLTEAHNDLTRQSIGATLWGVDRSSWFADGPATGSPYLGSDADDVFAEPAPPEPMPPQKPNRLSVRTTRTLVVIAWIIAGLGILIATITEFGAFSNNPEIGVPVFFAASAIALGAMFLDGGTASYRGTLTRWAVIRVIGVATLGIYVGAIVLLIPALWGLFRRQTGGPKPRYEQRQLRNMVGLLLSTLLISFAVVGAGRLVWWSPITSTQSSIEIGIGVTYIDPTVSDALGEVAFVPYQLDGLPSYQSRVAAVSLKDGALLWDRKLDSIPITGYPLAVTSIEQSAVDPAGKSGTVVVTTEHGDYGFFPDNGDMKCGMGSRFKSGCSIELGQGTLAHTDKSIDGDPAGIDLTDGETVLDPATGEPAGDGFRIEHSPQYGVRIVAGDSVSVELDDVSSLHQVLVAPSGTVALLMSGENRKSVLVVASKDGIQRATIGDRGLVAWPAWMG